MTRRWTRIASSAGLLLAVCLAGSPAGAAEGARWGARDPLTTCAEIDGADAPAAEAVADLVRCERETVTASDELWLMEDVAVRVGGARAHLGQDELMSMPDADTAKPVHPLRGSWTWVVCRDPAAMAIVGEDGAHNCSHARVEKAEGACWMTTFGTWRCGLTGPAASAEHGFAPPR
jgi:hypothetical protein